MKIILYLGIMLFTFCGDSRKNKSTEWIDTEKMQTQLYISLMAVTKDSIEKELRQDSLAFLILPLEVSCPSCRKKTIDSILKYRNNLASKHFIILTASQGKEFINQFFRERKGTVPKMGDQIFLDSINHTRVLKLANNKPTIYYSHQGKVFKKVSSIPETVKDDLNEFFSGHRKL
jgi:hypothetical protein